MRIKDKGGYSLVEVLVSLALFSIVIVIAVSGLALVTDANRRAEAARRVIDNLDFVVEDIIRTVRLGSAYHCGTLAEYEGEVSAGKDGIGSPRDCTEGEYLAFESVTGDTSDPSDQIVYRVNGGVIEKTTNPVSGVFVQVSDPQIEVENLKFYVAGSLKNDNMPARILIVLQAITGRDNSLDRTAFNIQTTVTQRGTNL